MFKIIVVKWKWSIIFIWNELVYDLRTQNMNFVAPIPEQVTLRKKVEPKRLHPWSRLIWLSGDFIEMKFGGF